MRNKVNRFFGRNNYKIFLLLGIVLIGMSLIVQAQVHQIVIEERLRQVIIPFQAEIKATSNLDQTIAEFSKEMLTEVYRLSYGEKDTYLPTQQQENVAPLDEDEQSSIYQQMTAINVKFPKMWQYRQRYFAIFPISDEIKSDWIVVVMPVANIVSKVMYIMVLLILTVILTISIMSIIINRQYFKPLSNINDSLQKLVKQDYDVQLPIVTVPLINELTEYLHQVKHKIKVQDEVLNTAVHQRSVLINHLMLGIVVIDAFGKVILSNPAANVMLDIDAKHRNLPYTGVIKSYAILSMIERVKQMRVAQRDEVELWIPHTKIVDVNIVPYGQGEMDDEVLILLYDLTEIRRLEEVRSEFVANASHELRTPVTAIKGFAETLQSGAINQPDIANQFVDIIAKESQRLEIIIEDILSLSRIEKQELEINVTTFNLVEKIRELGSMFSDRLAQKQMVLYLPQGPSIMIETDEQRIERILINLIDNAINYSDIGSSINVCIEEKNRIIRISVIDQGVGISQQDKERIFERFYRVDKARSRQTGGTGLGLSIVRHLVKTMNGTISVHSKLGEGSTFTVRLPKYWQQRISKKSTF